ncbi:MAG: putative toxin-antitoxin system toxin component, PIN family [Acidimicrobiales bacterium]
MRAVLDLNVLVSALINPAGVPAGVVRLGLQRRYEIVVCPRLLAELEDVLRRPAFRRYFSEDEAVEFVAALSGSSHKAPDPTDVEPISRDPDDDYLVALAS